MPPFGPLKENTTIQVWHLIAYLSCLNDLNCQVYLPWNC